MKQDRVEEDESARILVAQEEAPAGQRDLRNGLGFVRGKAVEMLSSASQGRLLTSRASSALRKLSSSDRLTLRRARGLNLCQERALPQPQFCSARPNQKRRERKLLAGLRA